MIAYLTNSTPVQLNTTNDPPVMSTSAAAAGSNDTAVNYIPQELVCSDKIKRSEILI